MDMREFSAYEVKFSKDLEYPGWGIYHFAGWYVFGMGSAGMDEKKSAHCKAFCDYWCQHLNMAHMNGRLSVEGKSFCMTEAAQKHFDELYRKAFYE